MTRIRSVRSFRAALIGAMLVAAGIGQGQFLEAVIPVGDSPSDILWNPTSNKAYVANSQDGTVTIIDGATNQVRATIAVPDYPGGLCWNSVQNKVYCPSRDNDQVAVIDGWGDTVIKTFRTAARASGIAYNSAMNKLYVACNEDPVYRVTVVDAGPDTVLMNIAVRSVGALLWHPATNRVLFYIDMDADTVMSIDCASDEVVARSALTNGAYSLGVWCLGPANGLAYLAGNRRTLVFNALGDSQLAEVWGPTSQLCAVPLPGKLYMTCTSGPLRVLDCGTNTIMDSLPLGTKSILFDSLRGKVYTTSHSDGLLAVIDAREDTLLSTMAIGRYPAELCWNSTNARVYVADHLDDAVYVIRDTTNGIEETALRCGVTRLPRGAVVRGAFNWPGVGTGWVLDVSGRPVSRVEPGVNDVSRLAAGVYSVVAAGQGASTRFVKLN